MCQMCLRAVKEKHSYLLFYRTFKRLVITAFFLYKQKDYTVLLLLNVYAIINNVKEFTYENKNDCTVS